MKKPRNIIGGQLQKIRLGKDISQMELSAINQRKGWNISRYIIAKIESGSRGVNDFELVLLAESLQIRVVDLFPNSKVWSANKKHFMYKPQ
jgi:transcriptional regulator with XRE-family HTH domain